MLHQNTVSTLCLRIAVLHQLNNSSEKSQKIKSTDVSGAVHAVLQKRWKHTAAAYHVSHKSSVPYAPGTWDEIWHNQTCGFWARNICSNTCGRVVVQQQYTAVPVVRYVWSHISSIPGTDSSNNRYKIDSMIHIYLQEALVWYLDYCWNDTRIVCMTDDVISQVLIGAFVSWERWEVHRSSSHRAFEEITCSPE